MQLVHALPTSVNSKVISLFHEGFISTKLRENKILQKFLNTVLSYSHQLDEPISNFGSCWVVVFIFVTSTIEYFVNNK